jgi:hypothetical protein
MVTPASPSKLSSSFNAVPMGVMGVTTSGAPIYNPLSSSNGSLASYYEWTTLDPCYGHTDADYQYHYHAVSGLNRDYFHSVLFRTCAGFLITFSSLHASLGEYLAVSRAHIQIFAYLNKALEFVEAQ